MKWRKNRPSSSSSSFSSRFPSLSRVLPTAWLSSFKQMSINSEEKPAKEKQKEMKNSMSASSSKFAGGGDAEDFWRLSFGEDSADGKTSKTVSRSAWYDSEDELDFELSNCQTCGSNVTRIEGKVEAKTLNNMACNAMKMKEFRRDMQILPEIDIYKGENTAVLKTPRSRTTMEKDLKSKKTNGRVRSMEEKRFNRQYKSGEAHHRSASSVEKNTLEKGDYQRKHQYPSAMNLRASSLTTINEDYAFKAQKFLETDVFSREEVSSEGEKWKEKKIEKLKQRKSVYTSRELPRRRMKHSNKVRVFSPRTASKIKALEDMKKAKLKMKVEKQNTISQRTDLENFAMVKCTFDPEKDFRDSMMEMIRENRISQPEELEELLACYLTLNSDAYHDLIIKVFQQVWFDMDQTSSEIELQNEQCSF
ncbi:ovate family protein 5 [Hibiscus trionum]|uniref:Transcription repressor n=1 Tax=Hibiscus trionum TaxID=183268 RepID=A0A9W7JLY3_HIBTR|nr:ovate family protein 5 [Hibiscus trionum]